MVQTKTQQQLSAADLEAAAASAIENSRIMNPDLPAANVAELAFKDMEKHLTWEMGRSLIIRDFIARDHRSQAATRRKERERQFEMLFASPSLREILKDLPSRLRRPKTELSDYQQFLKDQNAKDRDRHATNPATLAAKKLIESWPKPTGKARKAKNMTIAEVDSLLVAES
jgi:hypothetical protein